MDFAIRELLLLERLSQIGDDIFETDDDLSVLTLHIQQFFNFLILLLESAYESLIFLLQIVHQILLNRKFFLKKPLKALNRFDGLLVSISLLSIAL